MTSEYRKEFSRLQSRNQGLRETQKITEFHTKYSLGLFCSSRPSKVIKLNLKPFVNFLVKFKILVTDLLGC